MPDDQVIEDLSAIRQLSGDISQLEAWASEVRGQVEARIKAIQKQILAGNGFEDPILNWVMITGCDFGFSLERLERLENYYRQLEQSLQDHQGQFIMLVQERLEEWPKIHYLAGGRRSPGTMEEMFDDFGGGLLNSLVPPPQPRFHVHTLYAGFINGTKLRFDFLSKHCFLPVVKFITVAIGREPDLKVGGIELPYSSFVGKLPDALSDFIDELRGTRPDEKYQLVIGDEAVHQWFEQNGDFHLGQDLEKVVALLKE